MDGGAWWPTASACSRSWSRCPAPPATSTSGPATRRRRLDGTVALFDWSFTGDAALGEDIGNQVPDGVFDLFWSAERVGELDEAVFHAYLDGLRQPAGTGIPGSCGWA